MNITLATDKKRTTYRKAVLTELEQLHRSYNRKATDYHNLHQQILNEPEIDYHDFYISNETGRMMLAHETLAVELENIDTKIEELSSV